MEVVFTFNIKDYQKAELETKFPDITFYFGKKANADTEIETAEVLVTYGSDIDASFIERAKLLKWIMVASAGVEKMPLKAIAKQEIIMTNVRGIHKTPMAESVLAHILALRRSLPLIYDRQKNKEWDRVNSTELKGSTAIILGPGAIGSEIGRLLQAFGVRTIGCNRSGRESESMDETIVFKDLLSRLSEADYVISVLPSTPETKGLLTSEHFSTMKETAVFMNFGRGDLVEEKVLINALKKDEIGHAVLDVFEVEPLPADNELWTLKNCVVSPHVSGLSGKYVERALVLFEENLMKWLLEEKELNNLIEIRKGY